MYLFIGDTIHVFIKHVNKHQILMSLKVFVYTFNL